MASQPTTEAVNRVVYRNQEVSMEEKDTHLRAFSAVGLIFGKGVEFVNRPSLRYELRVPLRPCEPIRSSRERYRSRPRCDFGKLKSMF
jgi:hypothetical protein